MNGLRREGQPPGLDSGQIQDVADEAQEVLTALQDLLDALLVPLGECLLLVALKQLSKPEDGVERRAQLVAHGRQELALRSIGRISGDPRLPELLLTAHVVGQVPDRLDHAAFGRAPVGDAEAPAVARPHVERGARVVSLREARAAEMLALAVVGEL